MTIVNYIILQIIKSIPTLISVIIGSGLTLLGIWLKSIYDAKENKKTRIFEARAKAYSGLIGHLNNAFAKYSFDISSELSIKEQLNKLIEQSNNMDYELSNIFLFSSNPVKEKLEDYKNKILMFRGAILADHRNQKLEETFDIRLEEIKSIQNLGKEIIKMIRDELK